MFQCSLNGTDFDKNTCEVSLSRWINLDLAISYGVKKNGGAKHLLTAILLYLRWHKTYVILMIEIG